MKTSTPSVSVHVKLTVDPARVDDFLDALRPTYERVTAEPLNTFFEVYRDDKTSGTFRLVENWNATAEYMINVQVKKDYYKAYHHAIQSMLLKAPEFEIFSRMPGNEWVSVRKESYPDRVVL